MMTLRSSLLVAGFVALVLASALLLGKCSKDTGPDSHEEVMETLIFADAGNIFWTTPTIVARQEGLYKEFGVDVRFSDVQTGLAAKNAVLAGSADLGLVATTPIAAGAFQQEESRLISTYVWSNGLLKIASMCESGVKELSRDHIREDWDRNSDIKVGYVPGTISEQLLDSFLDDVGLPRDAVRRVAVKPPLATHALETGDVDYVVIWEPFVLSARSATAKSVCSLPSGDLYQVQLHLVTREEVIREKHSALVRFLLAVDEASRRLGKNPALYRGYVERWVGHEPGALEGVWGDLHFGLAGPYGAESWEEELAKVIREEADWLSQKTGEDSSDLDFRRFIVSSVMDGALAGAANE